jgi:hypothetical protein
LSTADSLALEWSNHVYGNDLFLGIVGADMNGKRVGIYLGFPRIGGSPPIGYLIDRPELQHERLDRIFFSTRCACGAEQAQ